MSFGILATDTPRMVTDMLMGVPLILPILFGITSVGIGGFYLLQILGASLRRKPYRALQKRTIAAIQAGHLGRLAIACWPLLAIVMFILMLPLVLFQPDFAIVGFAKMLLVITGVGSVAGIIAGGGFWTCSAFMGPVRKAVNRLRGRGVWEPELDGLP